MNNEEKMFFDMMDNLSTEEMEKELEDIGFDNNISAPDIDLESIKRRTFENIGIKTLHKKRGRTGLKAAAAVLVFSILGLGFMNYNSVLATIRGVFEYVPWSGIYVEKVEDWNRYILEEPVTAEIDGKYITLKGVIAEKDRFIITLAGTTPDFSKNIILEDGNGVKYDSANFAGGGSPIDTSSDSLAYKRWEYSFEFHASMKNFNNLKVIIDDYDMNIPFSLKKTDSFGSYEALGPTNDQNNVVMTVIPSKEDDMCKVNYITSYKEYPPSSDFYFLEYPAYVPKASLKGISGTPYEIINPRDNPLYEKGLKDYNALYFNLGKSKEKEFQLHIPYIDLRYKDSKSIKVNIPDKGETNLNLSFKLSGFPVDFRSVKRVNDDYIALTVDTHYDMIKLESLYGFSIRCPKYTDQEVPLLMSNDFATFEEAVEELGKLKHKAYYSLYNNNYPLHEYLTTVFIPIEQDMKSIDLIINNPQVVKKGPWTFDFKLDK
ncbi:MAG: hypothetical protein ACOYWZ_06495 [Bacillota bacterium]